MRFWCFLLENILEPLTCAQILKRQYTIVQPGWQSSNRRQNIRLRAHVKRANLYVIILAFMVNFSLS